MKGRGREGEGVGRGRERERKVRRERLTYGQLEHKQSASDTSEAGSCPPVWQESLLLEHHPALSLQFKNHRKNWNIVNINSSRSTCS